MGLRLMCVAGGAALVALLLLLTAAILRLAVLLVQLVTLRYSLAVCALALACWFVDSRRQRYAKGFYSCARVPQTQQPAQTQDEEEQDSQEQEQEAALVAPVTLPEQLKKTTTAPPSETESEDDDSEAGGPPGVKMPPSSSLSTHSKSFADVRVRSNTTDGELQRRQATRPRSSSTVGDSRCSRTAARGAVQRSSNADVMEKKRRIPRRRADTGMVAAAAAAGKQQKERLRRATFASKQDAYAASSRSDSDMLEDALRSDGYWIGDFRVQRRLVPRRSHAGSPKAN